MGKAVRPVKNCVGSHWCRYGSVGFGAPGHRPEIALPGFIGAAQVQVGHLGLPVAVCRGPW